MIIRYILAWFPMVVIAIVNGVIRERWYGRYVSELSAHQISTVTGTMLFGVYIWGISGVWMPESGGQALAVGGIWLVMTVCFEFLFGHYVAGHSWRHLLHDYHIGAGRIWALLLVWVAVAPYIFYRLQQ